MIGPADEWFEVVNPSHTDVCWELFGVLFVVVLVILLGLYVVSVYLKIRDGIRNWGCED